MRILETSEIVANITPHTEEVVAVSPNNGSYPFYCSLCGISHCDGNYYIMRKNSDTYCFEYIISGTGTVKTKGKTYYPSAGDMYMLMSGERHEYYSDSENPWVKIWFNIEGTLVDKLISVYNPSGITVVKNAQVREEFFEFLETVHKRDKSPEELFSECALIFHKILIKLKEKPQINEAMRLREYIDRNVHENLSIEDMASVIYRSPSQTIRIFKREYGITPYKYMLSAKMEAARLMLDSTNMMIKEIAFELKFADEHYFSNMFKKIVGASPVSYRKRGVK